MRSIGVSEDALLTGDPGDFLQVWVEDAAGTLVDRTAHVVSVEYEDPTADQPIGAATVVFRRGSGVSSLAPLMTADPPIDVGRDLVVKIDPGAGTHREVFRGRIDRTDWKDRFGQVTVECRDQGGVIADTFIEALRQYGSEAGVSLEDVMQAVADDNLTSPPTLHFPVATSSVVTPAYEQQQEGTFAALRSLAESIGWTGRFRHFDASATDWRFAVFSPDRSKATTDRTFGTSDYFDVTECNVDVGEIFNVVEVESPNGDGTRGVTTVSDSASIAKYGRRYLKIIEGDDSPIVGPTRRAALANAALSDLKEPNAVVEIVCPYFWPGEVGVDRYLFSANGEHFSSDQALAPVAIRHRLAVGERPESRITVRGQPSGGVHSWRERAERTPAVSKEAQFGLVDFREVEASAPGFRKFAWTGRGSQVQGGIWSGYVRFPVPFDEADAWATVAEAVQEIPEDQDWVEVPVPLGDEKGLLQVEPRLASLKVHSDNVIERRELDPVPPDVDVDLTAAIVSNAVDLTLKLVATDSSWPVTVAVYEGSESGTLLATFAFTANGTKTKTDNAAIGTRALPAEGKQTWVAVATDRTGKVYRDKAEASAAKNPYFEDVDSVLDSGLLTVDIFGAVVDPKPLGGTFEYWLPTLDRNAGTVTPADSTDAPTGSVVLAAGDFSSGIWNFDPSEVPDFNNVDVGPGLILVAYLKFTATDGRTTGAQPFPLKSSTAMLNDLFGALVAGSVYNGLVLAPGYRPYYNGSGAPTLTVAQYGTDRYFDTGNLVPYKYSGGAWVVDNDTPVVSFAPILRAGIITAVLLEATAVRAKLVGAERIQAENLAVSLLLEVGQLIRSTTYTAGSVGWQIKADGTAEFNNVTIRGTLDGVTGTFAGDLSAAGGTFEGIVAAEEFTGQTAEFDGGIKLANGYGTTISGHVQWGDSAAGMRWKPTDAHWSGSVGNMRLQFNSLLLGGWTDRFTFEPDGDFSAVGGLYGSLLDVTGDVVAGGDIGCDGDLTVGGSMFMSGGSSDWTNVASGSGNLDWARTGDGTLFSILPGVSGIRAHAYANFSDSRLKTDVQPLTGALAAVQQLQGVRYRYGAEMLALSPSADPQALRVGFIAQDLQQVLPEAVREDAATGYLTIAPDDVIPLLVEALKEESVARAALETTVAALSARLDALEGLGL